MASKFDINTKRKAGISSFILLNKITWQWADPSSAVFVFRCLHKGNARFYILHFPSFHFGLLIHKFAFSSCVFTILVQTGGQNGEKVRIFKQNTLNHFSVNAAIVLFRHTILSSVFWAFDSPKLFVPLALHLAVTV